MSNKEKRNKSEINMDELEQASGGRVESSGFWIFEKAKVFNDKNDECLVEIKGRGAKDKAHKLDNLVNYGDRLN